MKFMRRAPACDTPDGINLLREALNNCEAVIIGAGSGLSTSAGYTYNGARFEKYFADFAAKYKFNDMYSGGFCKFESAGEFWAYWSRHIMINRYLEPGDKKPVYENLLKLVESKDYFVLTTNVDHCFQRAGFDKSRLFYTQGDYGLFQCSVPCHQKTYDNKEIIYKLFNSQHDMKVDEKLIPHCPVCGEVMSMNLRTDMTFVEDQGWHDAAKRYVNFLEQRHDKKVLFWEIGTGMNTPSIIKFPFQEMTLEWPEARYACVNLNEAYAPAEIKDKSICINKDICEVLSQLCEVCELLN